MVDWLPSFRDRIAERFELSDKFRFGGSDSHFLPETHSESQAISLASSVHEIGSEYLLSTTHVWISLTYANAGGAFSHRSMLLLLLNNFGASKAQKDSQSVNEIMKWFLSDAFREDLNAVVFLQPIGQMTSN
jgi:hypothetical protein